MHFSSNHLAFTFIEIKKVPKIRLKIMCSTRHFVQESSHTWGYEVDWNKLGSYVLEIV